MNTTIQPAQQQDNDLAYASQAEAVPVQEENHESAYIRNLFDDEGAFGEGDCPGL